MSLLMSLAVVAVLSRSFIPCNEVHSYSSSVSSSVGDTSSQFASSDGTAVPTNATDLVDDVGAIWTISADGKILRDGVQASDGWGSIILFAGGSVWVYGTDDHWWLWTGAGWLSTTTSSNGSLIPATSMSIIDTTDAIWTIAPNGAILRDGVQAAGGWGSLLLWNSSTIYVYGTDDHWWQWTGSNWLGLGSSTPGVISPDGATVPITTTEIIDTTGGVWTIASNGAILRNGAQAASGWGTKILWTGSNVYVYGTDNNWWQWIGSNWLNTGLTTPGVVSTDGSTIPITTTQIVDSAHGVWTIASPNVVELNGMQAGSGLGSEICWTGGHIDVLGVDDGWWQWTGNGWSSLGQTEPAGCPPVSNSGGGSAGQTLDASSIPSWGPDTIERSSAPPGYIARMKAPGNQMHFSDGQPLRLFADITDLNAWMCPPGHPPYACPDEKVEFFDNGTAIGSIGADPYNNDMWELRLPGGLPVGDHRITCVFTPTGGVAPMNCDAPGRLIHIDPPPTHANTITLTSDLVLAGDLNWTDVSVIGQGFNVITPAGYAGNITIANAWVTGLGGLDKNGLDLHTSGNIAVEQVTFENDGPLHFEDDGVGTELFQNVEWRANNWPHYVSSNPDAGHAIDFDGTTNGTKVARGNNFGGGIVTFGGNTPWTIGGTTATDSNVNLGIRAVFNVTAPNSRVLGNYLHHYYPSGFSQGYNLESPVGMPIDVEQNVIAEASWSVQNICGTFRGNLVADFGQHDSWRTSCSNTLAERNIFAHYSDHGSGDSGIVWLYHGETGLTFRYNTFHGGGIYTSPVIQMGNGAGVASFDHNVVAGFTGAGPLLATNQTAAEIQSANFNEWWSGSATAYQAGITPMTPGVNDTTVDPQWTAPIDSVWRIDEGAVWLRQFSTFDVLSYYMTMFTPGNHAVSDRGVTGSAPTPH